MGTINFNTITQDQLAERIQKGIQERLKLFKERNQTHATEMEIAVILGMTDRWVRELTRTGVLKREPDGKLYDIQQSVDAINAHRERGEEEAELKRQKRLENKRYGRNGTPGIYMLFRSGELIYVGQSIDVHSRISAHRNNGRQFDFAAYGFCYDPGERSKLEQFLIQRYRPIENIMSKPTEYNQ